MLSEASRRLTFHQNSKRPPVQHLFGDRKIGRQKAVTYHLLMATSSVCIISHQTRITSSILSTCASMPSD